MVGAIILVALLWVAGRRRFAQRGTSPQGEEPVVERVPEDIPSDFKVLLTLMGRFMCVSAEPERVCRVLDAPQASELGIQLPFWIRLPSGNPGVTGVDYMKAAGYARQLEREYAGDTEALAKELTAGVAGEKHKALVVFCMRVLLADDKVQTRSLQLLEGIVKGMEVDEEWYRQMLHKSIPVGRLEDNEDIRQVFLGIGGMADDEEKKACLTRLYMKWNPVSTNSDPLKSDRARKLLGLITSCRADLDGQ